MATVGVKPKRIPDINLTEKHNRCTSLIEAFRIARKIYLHQSTPPAERALYKSILLGLMSSIGEQVAYIRSYHQQIEGKKIGDLENYVFIIPEIRNLAYHHLMDTEHQRSNLAIYCGVQINSMEDIITYITGKDYEILLQQVEKFTPPTGLYTRTVHAPGFNNPIGPYERLKMAKEAADEVIKIQRLQSESSSSVAVASSSASSSSTTASSNNMLFALDFHLTRMCVAYEDYTEELARLPDTDSAKINNISALRSSPELDILFRKIHRYKLALAHGDGSLENARRDLLNQVSACQSHFQLLATKIQPLVTQGGLKSMLADMEKLRDYIKSIDSRLSTKYSSDKILFPKEEKEKLELEMMKEKCTRQYGEIKNRFDKLLGKLQTPSSTTPSSSSSTSVGPAGLRPGAAASSVTTVPKPLLLSNEAKVVITPPSSSTPIPPAATPEVVAVDDRAPKKPRIS